MYNVHIAEYIMFDTWQSKQGYFLVYFQPGFRLSGNEYC